MQNIALIGAGNFGKKLLHNFSRFQTVSFICGRNINQNLLDLQQEYGSAPCDDYTRILDSVDLVVIATPAGTHYQIAKNCLERGKDLFVEKPLAATYQQAKELICLAEQSKTRLYVDDVFLYRKEYQELKIRIKGKKIRKVAFTWRKYGTFNDSVLPNLTYHDMYLLLDLVGTGESKEEGIENLEILEIGSPLEEGRIDILKFRFNYRNVEVVCHYDRTSSEKTKDLTLTLDKTEQPAKISWVDNKIVTGTTQIEIEPVNALEDMISRFLKDTVNYQYNHQLALQGLEFIEVIGAAIEKAR